METFLTFAVQYVLMGFILYQLFPKIKMGPLVKMGSAGLVLVALTFWVCAPGNAKKSIQQSALPESFYAWDSVVRGK